MVKVLETNVPEKSWTKGRRNSCLAFFSLCLFYELSKLSLKFSASVFVVAVKDISNP